MSNLPRTATESRRWWEQNTSVAYGSCWCNCGQKTTVLTKTNRKIGRIKGEPMRFLSGHANRKGQIISPDEYRRRWSEERLEIPFGYCRCGCGVIVKDNTRMLQVKLAARDAEHLASLRDALRSDYPIYPLFPAPQDPRALQIRSPGLVEGLAKHSIHPRKTAVYEWPDFLSDELLRHYLRGYFDGDGSFSFSQNQPRFAVEGQERFLQGCQDFLMRSVSVAKTKMGCHPGAFELAYSGGRQVPRIARWLYADATIYLPRKHQKVAHLL